MDLVEARGAAQRRHPWEEARFAFFRRVLREAGLDGSGTLFLDVGAGDGWFARRLAASAPGVSLVCWDSGYERARLPEDDAAGSVRFTADRPRDGFDVLLLLDVLEHVPDDRAFLGDLVAANLRPGGRLLFSVPAWQWLFSSHDVRLRHVRRYAPRDAREILGGAGLEIVRGGGLFHSLPPARALQASAERLGLTDGQRHAGEWGGSRLLTRVLEGVLGWDTAFSLAASARGWDVPGLSWWALCRRPS
jgi:SAM-dependent methyltransferase